MAVQLQRASVMAVVEETTVGTPVAPSAGTEFIPLRVGFSMEPALEELESDELLNSIGATKSAAGKESPTGSHPIYLKNSQVEGQAPEFGVLLKSAFGQETLNATEYSVTTGSVAGTSAIRGSLEMATNEEDNFVLGQGLLIKDGTNGYSIRNVQNVDSVGNQLDLNFNLAAAPASGVALGKAVLYSPVSTGHPSYTAWMYNANGGAIQAIAGARTSSMAIDLTAGQFSTLDFSYGGTEYFFNPVVISAANNKIDITDDIGTIAATLTNGVYKSIVELMTEIATQMTAASVGSGNDTYTATYDNATGKTTLTSNGTTFSLLWSSGANTATSIGTTLGFLVAADDTGATTYTSDNAVSLATALTPSYDNSDNVVVKSADLMIGSFGDSTCRQASNITFSIETPQTDVDDICAASGLAEKAILSRVATMTATLILPQYETGLFDKYINNTTVSVMANVGAKSAGNWVAGKCVNIYFQNASITAHTVIGDDFAQIELTCKGFVNSTSKDVYMNFL